MKKMKKTITFLFILTLSVFLLWLQPIKAETNKLVNIRSREYKNYLRIVFDFEKETKYNQPVVLREGSFSIDFYDVTTTLQDDIKSKLINKIEFVYKQSFLTAYIDIPVKKFVIKSFSLVNPFRIVCDIYSTPALSIDKDTEKQVEKKIEIPVINPEQKTKVVVQEPEPEKKMLASDKSDYTEKLFEKDTEIFQMDRLDDKNKNSKKTAESTPERTIEVDFKKLFNEKDNSNIAGDDILLPEANLKQDKIYSDRIELELKNLSEKITLLEQTISENLNTEKKTTASSFLIILLSVFSVIIILLLCLILFKKKNYETIEKIKNQDISYTKDTNPFSFDKKIKTEFERIKNEFDEKNRL